MVAGQVWRASGRGRGRGSSRRRLEPEAGAAGGEEDPEAGSLGSEGRDRPGALEVAVEDDTGDQGDSWWDQGWRTTPASWSNDSSWHEWHRSDGWNPPTWRDSFVARIEETTWGRDGRWQGSSTQGNSHASWHGADGSEDQGRAGKPTEKMTEKMTVAKWSWAPLRDPMCAGLPRGTGARSWQRLRRLWRCTRTCLAELGCLQKSWMWTAWGHGTAWHTTWSGCVYVSWKSRSTRLELS